MTTEQKNSAMQSQSAAAGQLCISLML